mgnify:CR=1 FL=1
MPWVSKTVFALLYIMVLSNVLVSELLFGTLELFTMLSSSFLDAYVGTNAHKKFEYSTEYNF